MYNLNDFTFSHRAMKNKLHCDLSQSGILNMLLTSAFVGLSTNNTSSFQWLKLIRYCERKSLSAAEHVFIFF